jgi:DNA mismatch endonuclease, patch repair protein
MRAVKSLDTTPETPSGSCSTVSATLPSAPSDLLCSREIVFSGRRRLVFVHGCFWHGHRCRRGDRVPKTNTALCVPKT